jgi:prevent-host-death family protein
MDLVYALVYYEEKGARKVVWRMSRTVNIHEAKTHLSRLLERVSEGEEIVIARAGRPVARLVPAGERPERREPGSAAGRVVVGEDFDAPLPEEVLETFER